MEKTMLDGKILPIIIRFTFPIFFGNLFQQIYNFADAFIAGRFLGVEALAAIGSTGPLIFLVIGWLNGMTSGFAIMIAQSFGAGDMKRQKHYLAMSIYLTIVMSVVMTAALVLCNAWILRLINTPEEIFSAVYDYMYIIYMGLLVTAAYNALASVLRALGDGRSPLYFLIISAVINVILDIVFIVYLHMGVEGCAYATVIAQAISVILCWIYMMRKYEIMKIEKVQWKVNWHSIWVLISLGLPMALQFSITAVGTIIVQGAVNAFGPAFIAGFSAAQKVQSIVLTYFASLGTAMATFAGQNMGAGKAKRILDSVKQVQIFIFFISFVAMLLVYITGIPLASLFVSDAGTEVLAAAQIYYQVVIGFYPMLSSIFLYRNVLQGMGYGFAPMMGGVFELIARGAVVVLFADKYGYAGVCFSDSIAWIFALIPIVPYYYFYVAKRLKSNIKLDF